MTSVALTSEVIFCDIGDVLGTPVFSPPPPQLKGLDVFPFVSGVLHALRDRGHRLGIISNTGQETAASIDAVLKAAELLDLFEPPLLVYSSVVGVTKESPEIFRLAAERAGLAPERCLFVGEDPEERGVADQVGFRVATELSRLETVLAAAAPTRPDIGNLAACVEDCRFERIQRDSAGRPGT